MRKSRAGCRAAGNRSDTVLLMHLGGAEQRMRAHGVIEKAGAAGCE
ncbi:MAG TPA: hypothetical protein VFG66_14320 [Gemmatimonadales bacterium]|nr:hypothetical protein [Gemmatimonadales bacterium]